MGLRKLPICRQWAIGPKMASSSTRAVETKEARTLELENVLFTESSAVYAGISSEAQFDFEVRPLPYWKAVASEPQNTIIGGASLWVMQGHESEEYKGVGEFLSFLSTSDVQAAWHQNTGYLPITAEAGDATRASGFYDENPRNGHCGHSNDSKATDRKLQGA